MPPFSDQIRDLLENKPDLLAAQVESLRAALRSQDAVQLARRCGAALHSADGEHTALELSMSQHPVRVPLPGYQAQDPLTGRPLNPAQQALLMYYFTTADGASQGKDWISFTDLPDGRFYTQAYQSYTGKLLAKHFENRLDAFEAAARAAGGERQQLASAAYAFQLLPRVSLLAAYWLGDEDFPASCQVLFSSGVSHYLPTDACAIAGSMLTRRLLAAVG